MDILRFGIDPLTGLGDRSAALAEIDRMLHRLATEGEGFAVVFLDLDNFKAVNDVSGHRTGDDVLAQVAERLTACVRGEDLVTRFGGDEFVLIVPTDEPETVTDIARRACGVLASAYMVESNTTPRIGASAGVVLVRDPLLGADEVIRRADAAMYQAKRAAPGSVAEWSPGLAERDERRQQLSAQLLSAMGRGQLQIRYQPEVDMASGRILGYEALLHWNHPVWGPLAMRDVLGAVRDVELLQAVAGHLVTSNAERVAAWTDAGIALRVDIDPAVLFDHQFPQWLIELTHTSSLRPGLLRLEIDERALDNLGLQPDDALTLCRQIGIPLDLDRFGLGSASLRRLTSRLFAGVKLAPGLIHGVESIPADKALVRGTTVAAEHLALAVVATGVDTPEQRDALLAMGVRRGQGMALAAPVDHDDDGVVVRLPDPRDL